MSANTNDGPPVLAPVITTTAPDGQTTEPTAAEPSTPPSTSAGLAPSPSSPSQQHAHSPAPTYETLPASTPPSPTLSSTRNAPSYQGGSSTAHSHREEKSPWVNQVSNGTTDAGDHLTRKDSSGQHSDLIDAEKQFAQRTDKDPKEVEKEEEQFQRELESEDTADVDMGPFTVKPKKLASLVDPKSLETLTSFGGIDGLVRGLGTDPKKGLDADVLAASSGGNASDPTLASAETRKKTYGANILPSRPPKSLFYLMYLALKDKVLIILCIAAVVSLALGIYQTLGGEPELVYSESLNEYVEVPSVDWVEGVAIIIAVAIVVLVGSVNDWQKEKQFQKLNAQKEDRQLKVIRSGNEQSISVYDVLVGDIAILEPGEIVPVDGVFLRGHAVKCDESGATGESDAIKKVTYDECVAEREAHVGDAPEKGFKNDCFLVSGGKVLEGVGEYVVIAVGPNSFNGRTMMALRGDAPPTPLQLKLNALAELIAKLGSLAGLILFGSLMIRFFVQLGTGTPPRSPSEKGAAFVDILIIAVTVVVVAVPEGLPLAVTLALAFATKRMTKMNLLVRVLGACETMANATVVCTDKTGTLTQNVMSVVAGSLGVNGKFVQRLGEFGNRSNADQGRNDFSLEMNELNSVMSPGFQSLLNDAIVLNSTAFEDKNQETGELEFVGSKTETALLRFCKELGWKNYKETRDAAKVVQMVPFSSERKASAVVIQLPNGKHRAFFKGASEILTKLCAKHVHVEESAASEVEAVDFTAESKANVDETIILYANNMLRTIAVCYRDFESWPPTDPDAEGNVPYQALAEDLTLLAITAIEDPLRPGVTDAVATCAKAGVQVKMVTGDNVLTAKSIAIQCGIFTPGGLIIEGPVFRELSVADRREIVPRLQVMARSSPEDKRILVATLQELGEIVGVTGDGTNDAPALKKADVGFSMGIAGTEVAKEASDIILMDDNFGSIVSAVMWGRCVNDSVRKFLQFQLSVNITAVLITFISAVSSNEEQSVLTAVQLLWVNLIMDTFAALALATDPATPDSLNRKPDRKRAPLITIDMLKMIVMQAIFQIIACLVLHFCGKSILNMECGDDELLCETQQEELSTIVFNAFVFCQVFNQLNCRRLDRGLNVFRNFWINPFFLVIFGIMCGGQVLIVFVGGTAFQVVRISGRDWAISIIVGLISLPVGVLVRLLPTEPFARFLYKIRMYEDPAKLPTETVEAEDLQWNEAIARTVDNLSTYSKIRGGRLQGSRLVLRSRNAQLTRKNIQPTSLLAMLPTIVASSVGAGWRPETAKTQLGDDATGADLASLAKGISVHPDTPKDDPYYVRFGPKK